MGKDTKTDGQDGERYGEVVHRLEDVVKRLEAGDLSLEDSLKAFEEGIKLVRKGEHLLTDAERRIEQLLSEDGADRAAPLELPPSPQEPGRTQAPAARTPAKVPRPPSTPVDEDDVPF